MTRYQDRVAALDALDARFHAFRQRPFPTDWAKVVNGVGLASLAMRAERSLGELSWLSWFCNFRRSYLLTLGEPEATAGRLHDALRPLVEQLDRVLPALPPEPQGYFADFRALVADPAALAARWWTFDDPVGSGHAA